MNTERAATNGKASPELEAELMEVAKDIAAITWELKALNTVVIDLRGRVSYTDFVIITTGTSERHVAAIARSVDDEMREAGRPPMGTEGLEHGQWALLDYGDMIVHVFNKNARKEYDLERMWSEAPRLELEDKPEDLYGHFEVEDFT